MTQQHFAQEADINYLISRYVSTGVIPQHPTGSMFGDFSEVGDYRQMVDAIMSIDDNFMTLDSKVRARFDNDPGNLMDFLAHAHRPDVMEEGIALGLFESYNEPESPPHMGDGGSPQPPASQSEQSST